MIRIFWWWCFAMMIVFIMGGGAMTILGMVFFIIWGVWGWCFLILPLGTLLVVLASLATQFFLEKAEW